MPDALIGFSGYVGSTLLGQRRFDACYRSTNIQDIDRGEFDTVVCAGAPAQKWIANREPEDDRRKIDGLISHLETIRARQIVLISTVDVFSKPVGVDETTKVDEEGLHAYGLHRRMLEVFVERRFPRSLIVRLPGLVGPGLRKNVIFDFVHDNKLEVIDSRGMFQFYPMVNLWYDIESALAAGIKLVHLTAEPISVHEVAKYGFGQSFDQACANQPASYDMRSVHAALYGGKGAYQYSKRETIQAIRAYVQFQPHLRRAE